MIAVIHVYFIILSLCLLAIATESFQQKNLHENGLIAQKFRGDGDSGPLRNSQLLDSPKDFVVDNICVLVDGDEEADPFREDAKEVASALGIPLLLITNDSSRQGSSTNQTLSHALRLVHYEYGNELSTFALAIEPMGSDSRGERKGKRRRPKKPNPSSSAPFFVDLCPPPNSKAGRRASGASGKADLLVKAVGPRKGPVDPISGTREGAVIWDLTAGLGQDSLMLARNGARRVKMVERHPIVAALLKDAVRRLELLAKVQDASPSSAVLLETLDFVAGEARAVLKTEDCDGCDVVYLDPMFPPRQKQSAVKKGMSILHGLLETHVVPCDDNSALARQREEQELLEAALGTAKLRVVVKRPVKAPLLGDGSTKPSHALTGSFNRWDVYVKPPSSSG